MNRPALLDGRTEASNGVSAEHEAAPWSVAFLGGSVLLREALGWWLSASGEYRVAGSYADVTELLAAPERPEVVLVDVDGLEDGALARLRAHTKGTRVVLLAAAVTPRIVQAALKQRVEGVLLTSDVSIDVLGALKHVMSGRVVYPAGWQEHADGSTDDDPLVALSARQREVLELVSQGCRNDEIAQRLFVSYNTVKFHMHEIYARLGVRNRVEAAQLYRSAVQA